MESEMPPPTIGMQIDNIIEGLNHLSSTQLYIITVTCMAIATFIILSPAGTPLLNSDIVDVTKAAAAAPTKPSNSSKTSTAAPAIYGYLRMVNFIGLACFLASLVAFFNNAEAYSSSSPILYRFLIGWSAYLAYFFSFNGVSIIYDNLDDPVAEEGNSINTNTSNNNNNQYSTSTTMRYAAPFLSSHSFNRSFYVSFRFSHTCLYML